MKDARFTLEFLTHVLANDIAPDGRRDRFQHASDGAIVFRQTWWYSALDAAIKLSDLRDVKPGHISLDPCVKASTATYKRKFDKDGRTCYRTHEAIMPGTRAQFAASVDDHITTSTLQTLLHRMGRFVGLSPYGHKLGFGRFQVVSVEVNPSIAANRQSDAG